MLDFRDVPNYSTCSFPKSKKFLKAKLPICTVGKKLSKSSFAAIAISKAWKKWFAAWDPGSPVERLQLGMGDLAFALSEASNVAMHYQDCLTFANLYLTSTSASNNLAAKPFVARLPAYHRAVIDQLLGVGLSFAVARHRDYIAFASKPDYDKLMGAPWVKWTRPWIGDDGPDVLALSRSGQFAFIEIKGRAKVCARMPVNFGKFKAQSLNARLGAVSTRHILSYAYLPSGTTNDNAMVRWFNAAAEDSDPTEDDSISYALTELAVVYCHYQTILRNAGLAMPPANATVGSECWRFDQESRAWVERGRKGPPKLFIPLTSAVLFRCIERLFERVRRSPVNLPIERMRRLYHSWRLVHASTSQEFNARDTPFVILHRYGNGGCIVRELNSGR